MSEEVVIATEEIPLDQATQAEYKKSVAEGKETATRETVTEAKEETADEKPKVKGGFQARIDRLIKQQAELEEKNAAAEKRAAELEAKINGSDKAKASDEPKREAYETEADYIRALTRWEVKQEIKAEKEAEAKAAIENQIKQARGRYNARMIAIQEEEPEIKELMKQDIQVPSSIESAVTLEMENGADVVVFLAQHPEICAELVKMPPSRAIAEVWGISKQLEGAGETDEEEEIEEKPAPKVEEKPKLRPIRTVTSGSSTRSTVALDKTDFQAFKKLRNQGRVQ